MMIRQKRQCLGLSQRELARRLGRSRISVIKWESGRSYPNLGSLKRLAKVFDCSISDLIGEEVNEDDND